MLKAVIDAVAIKINLWRSSIFQAENGSALGTYITRYKKLSYEVTKQKTLSTRVNNNFGAKVEIFRAISEKTYYYDIADKFSL